MSTVPAPERVHGNVRSAAASFGTFLPLLLVAIGVATWIGFQTVQLIKERDQLRATLVAQETPVQESQKLRDSLDRVARETQLLADKGNPNARLIVDELRKRGVTINPVASSSTSGK